MSSHRSVTVSCCVVVYFCSLNSFEQLLATSTSCCRSVESLVGRLYSGAKGLRL